MKKIFPIIFILLIGINNSYSKDFMYGCLIPTNNTIIDFEIDVKNNKLEASDNKGNFQTYKVISYNKNTIKSDYLPLSKRKFIQYTLNPKNKSLTAKRYIKKNDTYKYDAGNTFKCTKASYHLDKPKTVAKKPDPQKTKIVDDGKIIKIGSGTGFVISKSGHVISNNHVVGVCKKVMTVVDGKKIFLDIIATDKVNDLGLIKGKVKTSTTLSIKSDGAELGEDIVAFGYPLTQQLSDSVKVTKGVVSALSGMDNNYSQIQIDAAIQPGNSGGPVLNMNGQVVGVASSGLSKLYMAKKEKYIPENVNFAVASPTLSNFLKANKINFSTSSSFRTLSTKDLAKIGRPATIQLFCMNTRSEYTKLKKAKTHSDMLLDLD